MNEAEKRRRAAQIIGQSQPDEMIVSVTTHSAYAFDFGMGEYGPELIIKHLRGEGTHPLTSRRFVMYAIEKLPLQDPTTFRLQLAQILGGAEPAEEPDAPEMTD